jgi:hypothetical protein
MKKLVKESINEAKIIDPKFQNLFGYRRGDEDGLFDAMHRYENAVLNAVDKIVKKRYNGKITALDLADAIVDDDSWNFAIKRCIGKQIPPELYAETVLKKARVKEEIKYILED